jgi:phosphoglycerate kinase
VVKKKDGSHETKKADAVLPDELIYDAGPSSVMKMVEVCKSAALVIWNGPLGNFEVGFRAGTDELAEGLSLSSAHTIVGGGDTIASIEELKLFGKFGFVSTGGGAMLDFLATGTLPAIEAVLASK